MAWRNPYPVRKVVSAAGGIRESTQPASDIHDLPEAKPWHSYFARREVNGKLIDVSESIVVPYASRVGGTGLPEAAGTATMARQLKGSTLHSYPAPDGFPGWMQVYTNMYRLLILAMVHPMLRARELQNIYKAAKGRAVDKMTRRAITGHQSDFNLKLSLVGSGATFYMGVSTHGVPQGMLKLWYSTEHVCSEAQRGFARAVLFDLCEAQHIDPDTPRGDFAAPGALS